MKNQGGFYYIEVRSKAEYKTFRILDDGEKPGIERVTEQRGRLVETVKWLVSKEMTHVENGKLVACHSCAKKLLDKFYSAPEQIEGNIFRAKDKPAAKKKAVSALKSFV